MEIDLLKLMRAVHLDCERTGYGHVYLVSGTRRHTVNLDGPHGSECDCYDFQATGAACKHVLRALLAEGEPSVLRSLRNLVPNPDRARRRQAVAA